MQKNVFDIYRSAERIARQLALDGRPERAETIRAAISGGATGTEILMRLRCALRQLTESDTASDELIAGLDELLNSIEAKLE